MAIQSFRHRGLKRFWQRDDGRRLPPGHLERIRGILTLLAVAEHPGHLGHPGFRLHPVRSLPDGWSVRVSANWRIVFRFRGGHARQVDFVDYH